MLSGFVESVELEERSAQIAEMDALQIACRRCLGRWRGGLVCAMA